MIGGIPSLKVLQFQPLPESLVSRLQIIFAQPDVVSVTLHLMHDPGVTAYGRDNWQLVNLSWYTLPKESAWWLTKQELSILQELPWNELVRVFSGLSKFSVYLSQMHIFCLPKGDVSCRQLLQTQPVGDPKYWFNWRTGQYGRF